MPLKDSFNFETTLRKENNNVLTVHYKTYAGSVYMTYDFLQRVMISRTDESKGGAAVTPFSQLDREVLSVMRDKLAEMGGKPPELPPEDAPLRLPKPLKP